MAYVPPIKAKLADVRALRDATFPEYKRRKFFIEPTTSVTLRLVNWSEGSKNYYKACTIDGKEIPSRVDLGFHHPWNNPYEGLEVTLRLGHVIAEHAFRGQFQRVTFHVHPNDMAKLLPAPAGTARRVE